MKAGTAHLVVALLSSRAVLSTAAETSSKIRVHIVPHSHMDAGWLSTFEEYSDEWVTKILTSVTQKMVKNPQYKFTIGDVAYFQNWYGKLSPALKE